MWKILSVAALAALPILNRQSNETAKQAPELGRIHWERKLEPALEASGKDHKPVLLLFQEVPGWGTCVAFGEGPLSMPLIVEAAETLFHPVVIRNNVEGYEGSIRDKCKEPSWNYPVMRFVDGDGADILPRKDKLFSTGQVVARWAEALRASKSEVPKWLQTLASETAAGEVETALFAMTWYWEGEAQLGSLPGVLDTRAAWIGKREIVQVQFDAKQLSYAKLLEFAMGHSCDQWIYATSDAQLATAKKVLSDKVERFEGQPRIAKDSDQLYYLAKSPLRYLPLTPAQARRVNGALGTHQDPKTWLSPRQIAQIPTIEKALAGNPKALASLQRPDRLKELKTYADQLQAQFQSKKN